MVSRHFHSGSEEKQSPRIVLQRKKSVSTFDEPQGKMHQAVILTTEGIECDCIREHISNPCEGIHQGTIYIYGTFYADKQRWNVSILEIGEGVDSASLQLERAISYFRPDILLFISPIHGIQNVQVGDIVSATKVYAYEANKSEATFQAGTTIWNISDSMEQLARTEAERLSWLQRIRGGVPTSTPRVVLAPIASVKEEITSKRSQVFNLLRSSDENTLAVEMDEAGLLQATRACQGTDALVVCGIAEAIQEQSIHGEDGRRIAAEHASAFAFEVLARLGSKISQAAQKTGVAHSPKPAEAIEVFYSYVDTDEELVEKLRQQLVMLKRSGLISDWYAGKIAAGEDLHEHQGHLETARLILLLISPDYIASEQHYRDELRRALERNKTGYAKVVPVLLRPTSGLEYAGISGLQTIPRSRKEISLSIDKDQAFKEVAHEIEEIVKALKSKG